jgi:hypothetical protein
MLSVYGGPLQGLKADDDDFSEFYDFPTLPSALIATIVS